ncbi:MULTISPECIES: helix-turn-helix transcriptional regulator [unclassified Streptomyces]|uniref:helix-turn-helix domain-containing protein n=1 Tax=unclassified Streptomyces TaxID=2593676 RepID=UPI0033341D78
MGGEDFGPWLARQLSRMDISQAELAERVGLTRAAVSAWVNGRSEPRDDTKRLLAEVFGTDAASLEARVTDVVTTLPLQWHHRRAHSDGGREYGNAAAFAFDADMAVLTREATQNSLDERLDTGAPVRVEYTLHELTGSRLKRFLDALHWDELLPHYEQASAAPQKVSRSLRAALDDLTTRDSLLLLRVDDYNATGLTGPEYEDGRFAAVVRRQLDSHKASGSRAGGSYGLGKATLWATSRFGLVLVNSTLSEAHEGRTERRVIGRLDLPWHEVGDAAYAGPAWFGEPDTVPAHRNVARSWWAAEDTVRDLYLERSNPAPGTSFLIVGAHDASGDAEDLRDIHDKLVRSLADGFWAAMIGGRRAGPLLEATVRTLRDGRVIVPEERVDPSARHPALCRALSAYLDGETVDILASEEHVAAVEVPIVVSPRKGHVGEKAAHRHAAILLLTPAADRDEKHSRVVCMRGNRMTITEHRPRELPPGSMPFQAVLLAGYATEREGRDVALAEAFLRASEPPEHDRWDRTEELTSLYARGALTRLKEFRAEIDKAVRGLVQRETAPRAEGPAGLRELLRLDYNGPAQRRSAPFPTVDRIDAKLEPSGAWSVVVTVKLPDADDPWLLTPVAKFDVRSGGKPVVDWANLSALDNCRFERGNLVVDAGVRRAEFHGVTEPATHPVRGALARLVVEVQRARGGAA